MILESRKYLEQIEEEIKALNEKEESKKRFEAIEQKIKELEEVIHALAKPALAESMTQN